MGKRELQNFIQNTLQSGQYINLWRQMPWTDDYRQPIHIVNSIDRYNEFVDHYDRLPDNSKEITLAIILNEKDRLNPISSSSSTSISNTNNSAQENSALPIAEANARITIYEQVVYQDFSEPKIMKALGGGNTAQAVDLVRWKTGQTYVLTVCKIDTRERVEQEIKGIERALLELNQAHVPYYIHEHAISNDNRSILITKFSSHANSISESPTMLTDYLLDSTNQMQLESFTSTFFDDAIAGLYSSTSRIPTSLSEFFDKLNADRATNNNNTPYTDGIKNGVIALLNLRPSERPPFKLLIGHQEVNININPFSSDSLIGLNDVQFTGSISSPSHGDFNPRNVLAVDNTVPVLIDLERFGDNQCSSAADLARLEAGLLMGEGVEAKDAYTYPQSAEFIQYIHETVANFKSASYKGANILTNQFIKEIRGHYTQETNVYLIHLGLYLLSYTRQNYSNLLSEENRRVALWAGTYLLEKAR